MEEESAVTFKLPAVEDYNGLKEGHLAANGVTLVETAPKFVQDFKDRLMRKRYFQDQVSSTFFVGCGPCERRSVLGYQPILARVVSGAFQDGSRWRERRSIRHSHKGRVGTLP